MEPLRLSSDIAGQDDEFKAKALIFRGRRQALLASNIANADTPGYRAMDVSFADSLRREMRAQEGSLATAPTSESAAPTMQPLTRSTLEFARYVIPAQSNLDGNSVDMDRERSAFAQNTILYQLAIASLDDEWKEFKMASSDPRR